MRLYGPLRLIDFAAAAATQKQPAACSLMIVLLWPWATAVCASTYLYLYFYRQTLQIDPNDWPQNWLQSKLHVQI